MTTGTVKWFNATKGFGFIQPDTGGPDAFVHISAVERAGMSGLNEGQKVSYDLVAVGAETGHILLQAGYDLVLVRNILAAKTIHVRRAGKLVFDRPPIIGEGRRGHAKEYGCNKKTRSQNHRGTTLEEGPAMAGLGGRSPGNGEGRRVSGANAAPPQKFVRVRFTRGRQARGRTESTETTRFAARL